MVPRRVFDVAKRRPLDFVLSNLRRDVFGTLFETSSKKSAQPFLGKLCETTEVLALSDLQVLDANGTWTTDRVSVVVNAGSTS